MFDDEEDDREKEVGATALEDIINAGRLDRALMLNAKMMMYQTSYTRQHLGREAKNPNSDLPRPVKVGAHRIGYPAHQVIAWHIKTAEARGNGPLAHKYTDEAIPVEDRLERLRFVPWREARKILMFSRKHVRHLQKTDPTFPKQVQVGPNRVGFLAGELTDWLLSLVEGKEADQG